MTETTEWISVHDRMPEVDEQSASKPCIVVADHYNVFVARLWGGVWYGAELGAPIYGYVTHWMYAPQPPTPKQ